MSKIILKVTKIILKVTKNMSKTSIIRCGLLLRGINLLKSYEATNLLPRHHLLTTLRYAHAPLCQAKPGTAPFGAMASLRSLMRATPANIRNMQPLKGV